LDQEAYKRIKILGAVVFIPFAVGVGPIAGFFLGLYLTKKFSLGAYVILICITLGFLSGMFETIRIIKFMLKEGAK
jgi:uncharacterized protein YneF (UPF0154 family)